MNRARCKNCHTVIHSKHRHDFVECHCFKYYDTNGGHGIYLDGGDDYFRCGGNSSDIEYLPDDYILFTNDDEAA